jgi:hypothetical protein
MLRKLGIYLTPHTKTNRTGIEALNVKQNKKNPKERATWKY